MMNYSKSYEENDTSIVPSGVIEVVKNKDEKYDIRAKNIISIEDKEKIEPILKDIKQISIATIKERYKELRRSGKNTHSKGGGIGFYEIAKLANSIDYQFKTINKTKFSFEFKIIIIKKQKDKKDA
jgi:hypothetical protein